MLKALARRLGLSLLVVWLVTVLVFVSTEVLPGDALQVVYDRQGERITSVIKLTENPSLELVPAEEAGQTLTDAQRRFRDSWLSSAARSF